MIDELYNKSREREGSRSQKRRVRADISPGLISDKDPFNTSIKSMGFSEISHAFNMHFNKGDNTFDNNS